MWSSHPLPTSLTTPWDEFIHTHPSASTQYGGWYPGLRLWCEDHPARSLVSDPTLRMEWIDQGRNARITHTRCNVWLSAEIPPAAPSAATREMLRVMKRAVQRLGEEHDGCPALWRAVDRLLLGWTTLAHVDDDLDVTDTVCRRNVEDGRVSCYRDGLWVGLHVVVLQWSIEDITRWRVVHRDGNPANYRRDNLQVVPHRYSTLFSQCRIVTGEQDRKRLRLLVYVQGKVKKEAILDNDVSPWQTLARLLHSTGFVSDERYNVGLYAPQTPCNCTCLETTRREAELLEPRPTTTRSREAEGRRPGTRCKGAFPARSSLDASCRSSSPLP